MAIGRWWGWSSGGVSYEDDDSGHQDGVKDGSWCWELKNKLACSYQW